MSFDILTNENKNKLIQTSSYVTPFKISRNQRSIISVTFNPKTFPVPKSKNYFNIIAQDHFDTVYDKIQENYSGNHIISDDRIHNTFSFYNASTNELELIIIVGYADNNFEYYDFTQYNTDSPPSALSIHVVPVQNRVDLSSYVFELSIKFLRKWMKSFKIKAMFSQQQEYKDFFSSQQFIQKSDVAGNGENYFVYNTTHVDTQHRQSASMQDFSYMDLFNEYTPLGIYGLNFSQKKSGSVLKYLRSPSLFEIFYNDEPNIGGSYLSMLNEFEELVERYDIRVKPVIPPTSVVRELLEKFLDGDSITDIASHIALMSMERYSFKSVGGLKKVDLIGDFLKQPSTISKIDEFEKQIKNNKYQWNETSQQLILDINELLTNFFAQGAAEHKQKQFVFKDNTPRLIKIITSRLDKLYRDLQYKMRSPVEQLQNEPGSVDISSLSSKEKEAFGSTPGSTTGSREQLQNVPGTTSPSRPNIFQRLYAMLPSFSSRRPRGRVINLPPGGPTAIIPYNNNNNNNEVPPRYGNHTRNTILSSGNTSNTDSLPSNYESNNDNLPSPPPNYTPQPPQRQPQRRRPPPPRREPVSQRRGFLNQFNNTNDNLPSSPPPPRDYSPQPEQTITQIINRYNSESNNDNLPPLPPNNESNNDNLPALPTENDMEEVNESNAKEIEIAREAHKKMTQADAYRIAQNTGEELPHELKLRMNKLKMEAKKYPWGNPIKNLKIEKRADEIRKTNYNSLETEQEKEELLKEQKLLTQVRLALQEGNIKPVSITWGPKQVTTTNAINQNIELKQRLDDLRNPNHTYIPREPLSGMPTFTPTPPNDASTLNNGITGPNKSGLYYNEYGLPFSKNSHPDNFNSSGQPLFPHKPIGSPQNAAAVPDENSRILTPTTRSKPGALQKSKKPKKKKTNLTKINEIFMKKFQRAKDALTQGTESGYDTEDIDLWITNNCDSTIFDRDCQSFGFNDEKVNAILKQIKNSSTGLGALPFKELRKKIVDDYKNDNIGLYDTPSDGKINFPFDDFINALREQLLGPAKTGPTNTGPATSLLSTDAPISKSGPATSLLPGLDTLEKISQLDTDFRSMGNAMNDNTRSQTLERIFDNLNALVSSYKQLSKQNIDLIVNILTYLIDKYNSESPEIKQKIDEIIDEYKSVENEEFQQLYFNFLNKLQSQNASETETGFMGNSPSGTIVTSKDNQQNESTALADQATGMANAFANVVGKPIGDDITDEDAEFEYAALQDDDTFAQTILDMQKTIQKRELNLFKLEKQINTSIHVDTIESARKLLQQMNNILDQNKKIYYKMKKLGKSQTKTLTVRQFKRYYGQFKNLNALLISLLEKVKTKTRSVKKLTRQNAKTLSPTTRPGRKSDVATSKSKPWFPRFFGRSSSKTPPKSASVESSRFNPADWPDPESIKTNTSPKTSTSLETRDKLTKARDDLTRKQAKAIGDNPVRYGVLGAAKQLEELQLGGKTKKNRKTNANKNTRKSQKSKSQKSKAQKSKSQKSKPQKSKAQKGKSQKGKKRMNATRKRRSHKNHSKRYYLKTLKSRR